MGRIQDVLGMDASREDGVQSMRNLREVNLNVKIILHNMQFQYHFYVLNIILIINLIQMVHVDKYSFYTLGIGIIDNESKFISTMKDIDVGFPSVDVGTHVFINIITFKVILSNYNSCTSIFV
jgi:hypothetical protein